MDNMIARIMEIEKQAALEIEQAEDASRKNIEERRRALEEEKQRALASIVTEENARFVQAVEAIHRQTTSSSPDADRQFESLFRDPAKINAIKEKIVAVLLSE